MATTKTTRKRPAAAKKKPAKRINKPAVVPEPKHPRRLHLPAYKPFRFRRIKYPERLL